VQTTNRVRDDGRGGIGHAATLPFPSPLIRGSGDWRAGLGRSLCSLLARAFVYEYHSVPASSNAVCGFPRAPLSYLLRPQVPISLERLSALVEPLGSH
jgi:hypothetical protein